MTCVNNMALWQIEIKPRIMWRNFLVVQYNAKILEKNHATFKIYWWRNNDRHSSALDINRAVGPGGDGDPQKILADQLTLSQPDGGRGESNTKTICPSNFPTFLRLCFVQRNWTGLSLQSKKSRPKGHWEKAKTNFRVSIVPIVMRTLNNFL